MGQEFFEGVILDIFLWCTLRLISRLGEVLG